MFDLFNSAMNAIFEILFMPFGDMPEWGMVVVSCITGVLMLFIFKATSDQAGIKRAKNLVKGHFLAIRLYRDDIGLMFDTMRNIIVSNLFYMRKSLRPMLFLMVPVGIVLVQLGSRYEFRPFTTGERIVVSLRLSVPGGADLRDVRLDLPDGLKEDMPPVRIETLQEVNWRLVATKAGEYDLKIKYGDAMASKRIHVVDSLVPVAAQRGRDDVLVSLINPAEPGLEQGSFASLVSVAYPEREFQMFGFQVHWLLAFFLISLIAAFALKGWLGVEV